MRLSTLRGWYQPMARAVRACRVLVLTLAMLVWPLLVWAQDEDEKPVPLDPQTKAAQNRMFGVIALLIALALGWYWWRRWQITHARKPEEENERRQE